MDPDEASSSDEPAEVSDEPAEVSDEPAASPKKQKRRRKKRRRKKRRCRRCDAVMSRKDRFCDSCGARWLSAEEERHYRTQIEPALKKGAQWIGAMGILYVLGGIFYFAQLEDPLVLVINLVLAAIHAGLWQWAKRSLLPAAISALVLFITVHLLNAVFDPTTLVQGLIVKVIFLMVLWRALSAGLEARKLERGTHG